MSVTRRAFNAGLVSATVAARPAVARISGTSDVVVIGAGLSGLKAALDLKDLGVKAQVIEGRERVGGRVMTLKDLPGRPEAGGNTFGGGYGRCLDMCDQFKLPLADYVQRMLMNTPGLYLRGQHIAAKDWERSALNTLPEKWRKPLPFTIPDLLLHQTQPLRSPDDWLDEKYFKYDIPMQSLLIEHGFSAEQIELIFNTNVGYGTSAHDVSLLMLYFQEVWFQAMLAAAPVQKYVLGGNSQLPEAMAKAVGAEIHFNRRVIGIRQTAGGVETVCADGSIYRSKAVICTAPLPVMRHIHFDPILPAAHLAAVKTVPYFPMTQVHLVPKSAFWEDDGLAPAMWTDSAAGYLMVNRFADDPGTITSFTAWCRGFNAHRLDQLDPEDAKRLVVSEIERLRPAAKGQLEARAIKSWLRDPFAGGDYAIWAPGQVSAFVRAVGQPHGRIHFAGEHTALSNRGMEAAMESAERAVQDVMQNL